MQKIKKVEEISVEMQSRLTGGKSCGTCTCTCSCQTADVKSDTKDSTCNWTMLDKAAS